MKTSYVVVLPDGKEHFGEFDHSTSRAERLRDLDLRNLCGEALSQLGYTTPRNDPKTIYCQVYSIKLDKGQPIRSRVFTMDCQPPLLRLTANQYAEELKAALNDIPQEFHSFVSSYAWEQGHSHSHEEVLGYVQEIICGLKPAIKAYAKAIKTPA